MPVDSQYYQAEQVAAEGPAETVAPVAEATLEREDPQGAVRMELYQLRDAVGRWQKGVSGNPAGRPLGSRNRATLLAKPCSTQRLIY